MCERECNPPVRVLDNEEPVLVICRGIRFRRGSISLSLEPVQDVCIELDVDHCVGSGG